MIETLAKAGFAYIFRFVLFILLGVVINVGLALIYFKNFTGFSEIHGVLLGSISLITVVGFPIIWFILAKKTALLVAIFKAVDENKDDLVAYIIDTFLAEDNRSKIADFDQKFSEQSRVTQIILNFFFDRFDFFGDVQRLLSEQNYTDTELKAKMVEELEAKEIYEEWKPSFWTPIVLIIVNIGIVILATRFLG